MRLAWSGAAKSDYLNLLSYTAAESPRNARLVQQRIDRALSLLPDFRLGRPGSRPNTFKFHIPKTSHFVVYRISSDDAVVILAFVHTSRDWSRIAADGDA